MRLASYLTAVFLFGILPRFVSAEIILNEIAWMGTDEGGANCEWIELHNTGSAVVDLSAWTLTIENAGNTTAKVINLGEAASVKYSGVSENGYYLIARDSGSCKDLSPHTSADWLGSFGSGISNSGAKITLKEGSEERDVIDAKTGWEAAKGGIGGKNTAPKETPQRHSSSWITALPTPRGPNRAAPLDELPEEETEPNTPVVTVGGTAPLVPVAHPVPKLYVDGGPSRVLIAGADTPFSAVAYDSTGKVRKNADIFWAFGDGGQKKGEVATHAYKKPGSYTAVVRARDGGVSAVALIDIVVVDAGVSIASAGEDGITLKNASDRLADLSGWKIESNGKTVRIPPDTVVRAGATAFFPYETLRLASTSELALKFPNGRLAHAYEKPSAPEPALYPLKTLAVIPQAHAGKAASAPAPQETLAGAGAARSQDSPTVILAEGRGFFGTIGAFMASALSSVAGVFTR